MKRLKYIPGHEVTGVIEKLGNEVKEFKAGDRVAVYCIAYCGKCYYCQNGLSNYYLEFDKNIMSDHWNGGYAEYVKVPARCLLKLPDDVSTRLGNLTLDTLGCPYWMFENLDISKETTVAVYGCGPIGLAAIKILGMQDIGRVCAVDLVDNKLALVMSGNNS